MRISYSKPANRWCGALPIGNGHLGGMVYSGAVERIDLSENTFFSGEKSSGNHQTGAADAFYRMRRQLQQEDYEGALKSSAEFVGVRQSYGTNLPVGHLDLDFGLREEEMQNYTRGLDLDKGIVFSEFDYGKMSVKREAFASHVHNCMVYHAKASGRTMDLNIKTILHSEYGEVEYQPDEREIHFTCHAYETIHCDQRCGTKLTGKITVETDGTVDSSNTAGNNGLCIHNAAYIMLILKMKTDFGSDNRVTSLFEQSIMQKDTSYNTLKSKHIADIFELFHRVDLQICGNRQSKAVDLIPFMFQYGRYLLFSSSREDSRLPAHLQGIWNDNVACRIGWTCDMHLDINTQMNYWPAEVTNLPETQDSLFRWIEEELRDSGRETAMRSYGLKGWTADIVSNAWAYTAPYWAPPIAPCPTGGVWILTHMWEHYRFTGDQVFLRFKAFPVIEEAVAFFTEYLFEDESTGYYSCGPSISPENSFLAGDKVYQISNGCTYEILMIRELFQIYLECCHVLEESGSYLTQVKNLVHRLIPYRIEKDGSLAEWSHDYPAVDPQHRHTSHLLGVFPFEQITAEDKELTEAVKTSLKKKLSPADNWEDTGWARSMLILYEARLLDAERAYQHVDCMLEHLLEENYFIIHPPTRGAGSFDNVYELDGNTGLTSGIAEMLLQSHKKKIRLLPALPKAWESGYIKGLKARGNIKVSIYWEDGKLLKAEFFSEKEITCEVVYRQQTKIVCLYADRVYTITKREFN